MELEDLMRHRCLFRFITHCYREANKPSNRLAKLGANMGVDTLFDSFAALPPLVRGDIRMDRLGFPSFRRRSRSSFFILMSVVAVFDFHMNK